MLINIPIRVVYCWFAIILTDTLRITFKNETGDEISDIRIVGCGGRHIGTLQQNGKQTVQIKIIGDCSISVNYLSKGMRKNETVAGYVTNGMGEILRYNIDGKEQEIFF